MLTYLPLWFTLLLLGTLTTVECDFWKPETYIFAGFRYIYQVAMASWTKI